MQSIFFVVDLYALLNGGANFESIVQISVGVPFLSLKCRGVAWYF